MQVRVITAIVVCFGLVGQFALATEPHAVVTNLQTPESRATVIVISDTSKKLKSGKALAGNAVLKIERGHSMSFVLQNGSTKTIRGPFSGSVSDVFDVNSGSKLWMKIVSDVVSKKGNSARIAADRSGDRKSHSENLASLNVPFHGVFCKRVGVPLNLYRNGKSHNSLTIDLEMGAITRQITFSSGIAVSESWPTGFPQTGKFVMHTKHGAPWYRDHKFTVVEVNKLDVPSLASSGCETQLVELLSFNQ